MDAGLQPGHRERRDLPPLRPGRALNRLERSGEFAGALEAFPPGPRLDLRPGRRNGPREDPYLAIARLTGDTGSTPGFDVARAVADYVAWRSANPR
ncbi:MULTISPECIES: hypothetical protein [unclassified Actinomadura]|uniref:hypothetical protein n=1 Tax=unclassified Actinomadura TaxID=2626254 RepID=UPI00190F353A|nr:hypothetical protein [Actinomadura sp. K4S16]